MSNESGFPRSKPGVNKMKRIDVFPYNKAVVGKNEISRAQALEFAKKPGANLGGLTRVRYAFLISRKVVEVPRMAYTFSEWSTRVASPDMPHYFKWEVS
jgi:hypothetical protein